MKILDWGKNLSKKTEMSPKFALCLKWQSKRICWINMKA